MGAAGSSWLQGIRRNMHAKVGIVPGGNARVAILGIGRPARAWPGVRCCLASQEGNKEPGGVALHARAPESGPGGSVAGSRR